MNRCMRRAASTALLALVATATTAAGATFHLGATADAFISSANPTSNYGGAGALAVAAPGLAKGEFLSLIKFDFAAAKSSFDTTYGVGGWSVTAIALQLTAANPNNAIFNTSAAGTFTAQWMQNDGWEEGSGTPNTPGGSGITFATLANFTSGADQSMGTLSFSGATSGGTSSSLGLTSGIVADILTGGTASVLFSPADSTIAALFNSRSNVTPANRPLLTVTAVPEPSALTLTVGGGMVLARCIVLRRRQRATVGG